MPKTHSSKTISVIFSVLVLTLAVGFYVFGWTEPSAAPPSGNVLPPVRLSPTAFQIDNSGSPFSPSIWLKNSGGDDLLRLQTGDTDATVKFVVGNDGNVGVGTSDPRAKLYVREGSLGINWASDSKSALTSGAVKIENADPELNLIGLDESASESGMKMTEVNSAGAYTNLWAVWRAASNNNGRFGISYVTNDGTTGYWWDSAQKLTILPNGNVGIGTTSPGYRLDVNGDINVPATGFLRIAGGAGASSQVLTRTATGMAWQAAAGGGIVNDVYYPKCLWSCENTGGGASCSSSCVPPSCAAGDTNLSGASVSCVQSAADVDVNFGGARIANGGGWCERSCLTNKKTYSPKCQWNCENTGGGASCSSSCVPPSCAAGDTDLGINSCAMSGGGIGLNDAGGRIANGSGWCERWCKRP